MGVGRAMIYSKAGKLSQVVVGEEGGHEKDATVACQMSPRTGGCSSM